MLLLSFLIGDGRYAVDARRVIEVVPRIPLRRLPQAPAFVEGLYNHAGTIIPVVDLGVLLAGRPSPERLGTRLIVFELEDGAASGRPLGLIAEKVLDLMDVPGARAAHGTGASEGVPYLGRIFPVGDNELIQMLHVDRVLPDGLAIELYRETIGSE